jgi:hypothetical protein
MKNHFFLMAFIGLIFSSCQKPDSNTIGNPSNPCRTYDDFVKASERTGVSLEQLGVKRSWSEVLVVASEYTYGVLDTLRLNEKSHNSFLFMSEENMRKTLNEYQRSFELKMGILCIDAYFELLNSYPLLRYLKCPTEEAYSSLKSEFYAPDKDVYLIKTESNGKAHSFLSIMPKDTIPFEKNARLLKKHCDDSSDLHQK